MERYIEQLVADIRAAKENVRPAKMELSEDLEVVRGAEEYRYGIEYKIGKLFGLEKEQFPPVEKLTENQMEILTEEILSLWASYNLEADFPKGLPVQYKYKQLVEYLGHETNYITVGTMHFEMCELDPENCPYPNEFCQCKHFLNDNFDSEIDLNDIDPNEIPF